MSSHQFTAAVAEAKLEYYSNLHRVLVEYLPSPLGPEGTALLKAHLLYAKRGVRAAEDMIADLDHGAAMRDIEDWAVNALVDDTVDDTAEVPKGTHLRWPALGVPQSVPPDSDEL